MAEIEKLGRYDIVRVLGRGAMGVVYEGRDPNLDRQVAIKTIRVQNLTTQAASEYEGRFRTEARSVARLHHPNIVSVFDSSRDGDIAYLVMEYVQGDDLKHHLECGARFSVPSALVMVHDLLMALDHAHRQNVVHRDIKPANILIEDSGRIKLTDFGVARIQEPDESNLTQVGGAVGTPKYMSPEQAKGQRGDSRSDIFSAAVVLYELLTGQLPFDGDNQFIVIHQIVSHEAAPPSSVNPEVPVSLDEIMARALVKEPDQRYATAREFALALRSVAQSLATTPQALANDVAVEIARAEASHSALLDRRAVSRDGSSTGFSGPNPDVLLVTTVSHEAEFAAWGKISGSVIAEDLLEFLKNFPSGVYARRAQQRLDQLAGNPANGVPSVPGFSTVAANLDATVSCDATTKPLVSAEISPPEVSQAASVAPEVGAPAPKRQAWLSITLAAGMIALGVFFLPFRTTEPTAAEPKVQSDTSVAALPTVVASTPEVPAAPATPVSEPIAAEQPVIEPAPKPKALVAAVRAMAASAARSWAAPVPPASKPVIAKDVEPQVTVVATPPPVPKPVVPPVAVISGPSMAGEACADRTFVFRITCLAQQCVSDRYRQTKECVEFKALERNR